MVRIGRKKFSWNSVKFRIGGIASERIRKIGFGEKVTDELVYCARRDGVPIGVTAGKYEPDMLVVSWLIDEWLGTAPTFAGISTQLLALAGLTPITGGLSDIEHDVQLSLFEENYGAIDFSFPVVRPVTFKPSFAEGTTAQEIEVSYRVIDPIQTNGMQLASVVRAIDIGAGF